MRDAGVASAPLVNPSEPAAHWLAPGPADLSLSAPRLLVEIPVGYAEMMIHNPPLALEWRMATRAIFQHYLSRGYRVVDFFLSREAGRGQYLLAIPAAR
jgi:predicted GNAT superfamily acetyltransferase